MSILFSHGGTANAWMVSLPSIGWWDTALLCSGEINLRNALVCNCLRGWVLGSVWIPIHNLVALSFCLWCTGRIYASASAIATTTVWKTPVIAWAPILCALFNAADSLAACIQTLEA